MKNILDTNPIITACISEAYKNKVIKYLQDKDSLIILTIYNEIKDKLLMFHTILSGLEKFSLKRNTINLPIFKDLEKNSKQIYDFIKTSDNLNMSIRKLQISIGVLLSNIRQIKIYPNNDKKKHEIIETQKEALSQKLPKIKENDLAHLYLMYDYAQNFATIINFYTEDNKDYLSNREKIEQVLKEIKIFHFSEFM